MLEWSNFVAGVKLMPVPLQLNGILAEWAYFRGLVSVSPVPASSRVMGPRPGLLVEAVPTFLTFTYSTPCPLLSMSRRMTSPTLMFSTEETLMLRSPGLAS